MLGMVTTDMVIGVAEAGGLGSLPASGLNAEQTRSIVREIRRRTPRPLNLNFLCHEAPTRDRRREEAWFPSVSRGGALDAARANGDHQRLHRTACARMRHAGRSRAWPDRDRHARIPHSGSSTGAVACCIRTSRAHGFHPAVVRSVSAPGPRALSCRVDETAVGCPRARISTIGDESRRLSFRVGADDQRYGDIRC
ncbi:hypothetical protein [Bradyrhizobium sp. I71]|uniref:hypothetical protein n=1 Tax=Bradyrhizobium sp. I71 TaxID=2590772 RepID=UPI0031F63F9B